MRRSEGRVASCIHSGPEQAALGRVAGLGRMSLSADPTGESCPLSAANCPTGACVHTKVNDALALIFCRLTHKRPPKLPGFSYPAFPIGQAEPRLTPILKTNDLVALFRQNRAQTCYSCFLRRVTPLEISSHCNLCSIRIVSICRVRLPFQPELVKQGQRAIEVSAGSPLVSQGFIHGVLELRVEL